MILSPIYQLGRNGHNRQDNDLPIFFFFNPGVETIFLEGFPNQGSDKMIFGGENGKNQYFWKFGQISRICTSTKNHLFSLFTTKVFPVQCMQNLAN